MTRKEIEKILLTGGEVAIYRVMIRQRNDTDDVVEGFRYALDFYRFNIKYETHYFATLNKLLDELGDLSL